MAESIIRFEGVSKSYGEQPVLKNFSLDVLPGELLTIIGRSGCGKTTALKLVNGLITPDAGRVLVQGEDVAKTDPVALRRRIGYAIQSVGLFPHMTVEKNIAYVPAISHLEGWKGPARRERVSALLRQVGLDPALADRYPRALSGGQRQRVGIARALAAGPEILLMDEPFGALDAQTRTQLQTELLNTWEHKKKTCFFITHDVEEAILLMDEPFGAVDEITRGQLQEEILRIHRESGITILFVTHDIAEALKLGTCTLVMDGGTVQQCDRPEELLRHPATDFVRELVEPQRRRDSILQRRRLPL